ncbi:MAG: Vitamin B12 transporter BtuB [Haliscomenobacter sp.]|jgi:ferric enterobactin receptor|nr:Vitamin B12 transporter BtuB [Haliscomenobacter sp.]
MKSLIITLFAFLSLNALNAQRPEGAGGPPTGMPQAGITGRISGTILDSNDNTPIEFATVVLIDEKTQQQRGGVVTDEKGQFKFPAVKLGKYQLQVSFIGYQSKQVTAIELTPKNPDYEAGKLQLVGEGIDLAAVEVKGEAGTYENRIDKLVYNAEKDVNTSIGDATDVLQRVPMLAVDAEGNLSLRGSSQVQVLINGRPSGIFAANPADALRTIPADQIKSVEVITAPTARFDGEGSAGIVNIITKKKSAEGFTGSVGASVGTRSGNSNVSLNLVRGRFGLNFSGGGWFSYSRPSETTFVREDYIDNQTRTLNQFSTGDGNFFGPRATLGANYDFNAFNSLSTSFSLRAFGRKQENTTASVFNDPINGVNQDYDRNSNSKSINGGFDWTTDFRRTFKKPEQELSFAIQINGDASLQENQVLQQGSDASLYRNEKNDNDGLNVETTLQADYVHPFSKAIKLETGAKAIVRKIESDFSYNIFDQVTGLYLTDFTRSDVLNYEQDVLAGYLSFNIALGKNYGMVIGSRYEHTTIDGDFNTNETTFNFDYDNLLPSIIFSRKLNQFSNLRVSFSQRIQRPSLRFINPYIPLEDPRDITVGNPQLLPETTNAYELGYNTFVKGVVFNASLFLRHTNDVIENYLEIDDLGTSITTYQNIGTNYTYGLDFFSSVNLKDKLNIRGGLNVANYYTEATINGTRLSNNGLQYRGNMNISYAFPKNLRVEVSGFYNSPRYSLQGYRASHTRSSIGIRKDFANKKASLGFVVDQPFRKNLKFPNRLEGPTFFQESNYTIAQRSFGLSFNYRFGQLDFTGARRERRSKINNSDLKDGGDNSF